MKVTILEEAGFEWSMRGLARSFNQHVANMPKVAMNLANKDGGHNKFLESMVVWLDIEAPRFWWSEFDTYRVGITKQSDSTMHTLKRQPLSQKNFEYVVLNSFIEWFNAILEEDTKIEYLKNVLPDGFLQGRTVCTNYKVIRNIVLQRMNHKLPQWHIFCNAMKNLKYAEYLGIKDWHLAEIK